MKAVILAGGLGTRLREETEFRPKPMVEIGGKPVLWHIMKLYAFHSVTDFVVPIGYRGEVIRDYFLNYEARTNDFTVRLGHHHEIEYHTSHLETGWCVTVVDTGAETPTGGRVLRVGDHVRGERFLVTYGDGVADVDIGKLLAFHEEHGKLATMTTVRPLSRFGIVESDPDGTVMRFREKPESVDAVNAGFFVFEPAVFDYLADDVALEREPLEALAHDRQLAAYAHDGFWQPMDTYREFTALNALWADGDAPWKVWSD
ncbi:MAG TPA: glucose-1-phosphate cytidylyltransferase [Acidimicrobiia bacterium]|jgi:glucose-1-phosphate cytidylyltransferase|nr:glucose-1-phosphate cytidylyltransferase [Acidimicrobiia bacterium]